MKGKTLLSVMAVFVLAGVSSSHVIGVEPERKRLVFDGQPKTIVVHGYSTSFRWPKILQRKLDKHFGKRVVEVHSATKGGTPIAKWIDVETGKPLPPWNRILRPRLNGSDTPVIVLAQQSLQWVFGSRSAGIRNADDRERIERGAGVLQKYSRLLLEDGADAVFIAMHIYKRPMEPAIGNERLALAEFMKRKPAHVYAGPDVWKPTKAHYPQAFAGDRRHPNAMGAEIMAQKWFEVLLKHDGLEIPVWSTEEMNSAIKSTKAAPSKLPGRDAN